MLSIEFFCPVCCTKTKLEVTNIMCVLDFMGNHVCSKCGEVIFRKEDYCVLNDLITCDNDNRYDSFRRELFEDPITLKDMLEVLR